MKGSISIEKIIGLIVLGVLTLLNIFYTANVLAALRAVPGFHSTFEIRVIQKPMFIPLTTDRALFSLLSTTDEDSNKQIQELLAYSVFYGKKQFTLNENGNTIDIDLSEIIDSNLKYLLPDLDYRLVVYGTRIEFGKKEFVSNYSSSTTLTLPDLKKFEVVLYVG